MAITGTPAERRSAIWKYAVEVKDEFDVDMPAGGRVLSVQVQDGTPCVWVLVEPENAVVLTPGDGAPDGWHGGRGVCGDVSGAGPAVANAIPGYTMIEPVQVSDEPG